MEVVFILNFEKASFWLPQLKTFLLKESVEDKLALTLRKNTLYP